ncbi:inositol-pentakisphosphate 2-kinase [Fistulina hepatica ATCC 64428]|nr:inositol-pentakisphosphate 2-kinase [Fistulina hepatica ATCC 64428]
MSLHDISSTSPLDWRYISEGGATIVFSYQGASNSAFNNTVLRLRKCPVSSDNMVEEPIQESREDPDDPMIEYQAICMARLIPAVHLPRLESVRLSKTWLSQFSAVHNAERPQDRRSKDIIDIRRSKGVLATDLVGSAYVAVEIKPKWAFLPAPYHLSPQTREVKRRTCRFCMHARMKAREGGVVADEYCPLDLFSGSETRMRHAIHCLWNAWVESNGKINNLKIFIGGHAIPPSQQGALLAPTARVTDVRESFTNAVLPLLRDTLVLRTLSLLQRTLDTLDIEGLSRLWKYSEIRASAYREAFVSYFGLVLPADGPPTSPLGVTSKYISVPEPTIPDWTEFIDTYLSSSTQLDHTAPQPDNLRYHLLAYLLSATFKDCSIILRLNALTGTDGQGEVDPARATVIDLDPKSMTRLRKWERLDSEIVRAYKESGDARVCIDDQKE